MDARPTTTVTSQLRLELVVPDESTVPLTVVLRYCADDPFAVHASFRTGVEETVDWVFARDLLAGGVHGPTGDGDVRVWPSTGPGADVVYVALASPDGQALLQAPAFELVGFLERTYQLVPLGHESVDVDATLDALLGR